MALMLNESGCYGNCQQGDKPCTMPGVCGIRRVTEADLDARQAERQSAAARAEAQRIARLRVDLDDGGDTLPDVQPVNWRSFRPLLLALLTLGAVALVSAVNIIAHLARLP